MMFSEFYKSHKKFICIGTFVLFSILNMNWGFFAHRTINRLAVFTLPAEMSNFYKTNIEWVSEHAVDPDKRRYATKEEAARHYIDLDHYCVLPCEEVPRYWNDAVAKYTEDTLQANGIVPWQVNRMYYQLTNAFKNKNKKLILKYSAELGHYIADAHVPLHTTHNYNGLLTNQKGIHGFWESRVPELFADSYDFFVGKATYIKNPQMYIWDRVLESHGAVDSVLTFEKKLSEDFPSDAKYTYEERLGTTVRAYSAEYTAEYQKKLDNQIERRMRTTILSVGSFWYTAWVEAGQPDLNNLVDEPWTEEELKELQDLENSFKNGKAYGGGHED